MIFPQPIKLSLGTLGGHMVTFAPLEVTKQILGTALGKDKSGAVGIVQSTRMRSVDQFCRNVSTKVRMISGWKELFLDSVCEFPCWQPPQYSLFFVNASSGNQCGVLCGSFLGSMSVRTNSMNGNYMCCIVSANTDTTLELLNTSEHSSRVHVFVDGKEIAILQNESNEWLRKEYSVFVKQRACGSILSSLSLFNLRSQLILNDSVVIQMSMPLSGALGVSSLLEGVLRAIRFSGHYKAHTRRRGWVSEQLEVPNIDHGEWPILVASAIQVFVCDLGWIKLS